jgi:fused signal recognition particle receptor
MLNAKDTLQKIAEALNIAAQPQETTEVQPTPQPEAVEPTKELIEEPIAEVVEEVKTEVEEPKAEPQIETEAEPKEEVKDDRVEALESQLADLKKILADAMKVEEVETPVVPEPETKALTHSPEAEVKTTAKGVGRKGTTIQERVFKYINNN